MLAGLLSLTMFSINNTVSKIDTEVKDQVTNLQEVALDNHHLLNIIGNQSLHIDNQTDHTDKLIAQNYKDILINRQIQLDILNNLTHMSK